MTEGEHKKATWLFSAAKSAFFGSQTLTWRRSACTQRTPRKWSGLLFTWCYFSFDWFMKKFALTLWDQLKFLSIWDSLFCLRCFYGAFLFFFGFYTDANRNVRLHVQSNYKYQIPKCFEWPLTLYESIMWESDPFCPDNNSVKVERELTALWEN